jgi:hypothetical protein
MNNHQSFSIGISLKDVTWFCIFSGQRQMYKFGRNKLDHSERNMDFPYDYVPMKIKI